jgi:preprotein translocase subunit YajC
VVVEIFVFYQVMIRSFELFQSGILLAQQGAPASQPNPLFQIGFIVLLFGGMYFLLIAPQRKKQKEHEKMIKELKAGDEVVTAAGIYGKVTSVKNDRIVVLIAENTKVEMNPSYVHQKIVRESAASKKD